MAQSLQEKLAGLEAQFKQLVDNANAVTGAIQFCKQLIQEENLPVRELEDVMKNGVTLHDDGSLEVN